MEGLWLLTVVLVPVAFLGRDQIYSETVIAYFEVPKIALLRTLTGLMAALWLIEWGIQSRFSFNRPSSLRGTWLWLPTWPARLRNWIQGQPARWLSLAVGFFLATTLLSTALSGSFRVSMWGEIPGQDGYPAYTIMAYVLLYAVIATHLKSRPQLWRLLTAIVTMGLLVSGYAVLQNFGHDFLDLRETTGGTVTSFMGNRIFAAAVMMMTIPISLAAALVSVAKLGNRTTQNWMYQWPATAGVVAIFGLVLAIQVLGLNYTFSRGPWLGAILALVVFVGLVAVFVGLRTAVRAVAVLLLAAVMVFIVLQWQTVARVFEMGFKDGGQTVGEGPSAITGDASASIPPTSGGGGSMVTVAPSTPAADASGLSKAFALNLSSAQRLASVKAEVFSGFAGGRGTHWKVSWRLIRDHPWFEFDSLNVPWLRPIVGYGPDLFRFTYLLESPNEGKDLRPLEPDHAHNFFIHQTVEQGVLGLISALGIFGTAFLIGGRMLWQTRSGCHEEYKLVLAGLLAVLAGRFLEMMVGVARVSDLTVLWVVFGALAVMCTVMRSPAAAPPSLDAAGDAPREEQLQTQRSSAAPSRDWLWRLALVTWLIAGIFMITWVKTVNYPRAAMQIGEAVEHLDSGDGESTFAALNRAIELAPDVPVYHIWRADLYLAYLENREATPEEGCSLQRDLEYRVCLAARSYQSHLIGSQKSPFYYRSRLALANSALSFKRHEEAVEQYRQVLEMVPSSWQLRIRLADAYIQNGQPQAALQPLHQSMAIKASTEALFLRGRAYAELGRYHDAILDLDPALQSDPQAARGYVVRALVYAKLGQVAKSQQDIDRAVELGFDRAQLERSMRSAMGGSSRGQ